MSIGRAAADQAERVPTCTIAQDSSDALRVPVSVLLTLSFFETQAPQLVRKVMKAGHAHFFG